MDLEALMAEALDEARLAIAHEDVPIGAIVVTSDGTVVGRRHNERERQGDPTAHAEILALREASEHQPGWRLEGHTLVVTIEPCPMCAGAALLARMDAVVFGAPDPKAGACGSLYNLAADPRLHHEMRVVGGVRAEESAALVQAFFQTRRGGSALLH